MCCQLALFGTGGHFSHAFLPCLSSSRGHSHANFHHRVSLAVGFNVPASWAERDAATQASLYGNLKQLLRDSALAPCACSVIAATSSSCLAKRRTSQTLDEWNVTVTGPAVPHTGRDSPAQFMHLPCERWEVDRFRHCASHIWQTALCQLAASGAKQLFASHSALSMSSLHMLNIIALYNDPFGDVAAILDHRPL
jgi:hypothetical protein